MGFHHSTDQVLFQWHFAEIPLHFTGLGAILHDEEFCDKKGFIT